jgi:hypothetical protein
MRKEAAHGAAELAAARGEHREAAEAYERAAAYFEAALERQTAGDADVALQDLTRVSADHPRYREACVLAVTLASGEDRLSLALENLLARFLRNAPQDELEVEALKVLAQLYERHGFTENAAEALGKLASVHPAYADEARRLAGLVGPSATELVDLPPLPKPVGRAAPGGEHPPVLGEGERQPFHEGAVIGGRYRLEMRVGQGGSSVVFRATDLNSGDQVAVKVLTEAVFDAVGEARARRELTLSRQLTHRNVIRVFEMGLVHGLRYLTMELLEGTRLSDRMRGVVIPVGEGLGYLAQACAGLGAAHELGIVHRDVKPSNCFITRGGVLKVVDFGIAKLRDAPGLTATGVIAGTPTYMSPEQARDFRSVTPATDVYALGVLAYEMFTGAPPFVDNNPLNVLMMHRDLLPPPPRSRNPNLPDDLERIILSCLEKEPAGRPGCQALGFGVKALLDGI